MPDTVHRGSLTAASRRAFDALLVCATHTRLITTDISIYVVMRLTTMFLYVDAPVGNSTPKRAKTVWCAQLINYVLCRKAQFSNGSTRGIAWVSK